MLSGSSSSSLLYVRTPKRAAIVAVAIIIAAIASADFAAHEAPVPLHYYLPAGNDNSNNDGDGNNVVTCVGNYTNVDPDAIINCTTITADLIYDQSSKNAVILPKLSTVGGAVIVTNNENLVAFAVPMLQIVNGSLLLENNIEITSINVTSLVHVAGTLTVWQCNLVTSLLAPNLSFVGSDLIFNALFDLATIDLLQLTYIGGNLFVANTYQLTSLRLQHLHHVAGYANIESNQFLTSAVLPQLKYIGGQSDHDDTSLSVALNPALRHLSMPMLDHLGPGLVYMCMNGVGFVIPRNIPPLWQTHTECSVKNGTHNCPLPSHCPAC